MPFQKSGVKKILLQKLLCKADDGGIQTVLHLIKSTYTCKHSYTHTSWVTTVEIINCSQYELISNECFTSIHSFIDWER